jgi:hypothetical protein
MKQLWERLSHATATMRKPRATAVALILAGMLSVAGGVALGVQAMGNHIASQVFGKGSSQQVLDQISQKVVDKLTKRGGTLDDAKSQLVGNLTDIAGKKLDGVNAKSLLTDVQNKVEAAGLDKIQGINTNQIVDEVTQAVIATVEQRVNQIDLQSMAKNLVGSVDINKLVQDQLSKIDLNAIVTKAVDDAANKAVSGMLGGSSSGTKSPLSFLFGGH